MGRVRRRWWRSVVCVLAAYGLMRAAFDIMRLPLPESVDLGLRWVAMLLFLLVVRSFWERYETPPSTPLDTRRAP